MENTEQKKPGQEIFSVIEVEECNVEEVAV